MERSDMPTDEHEYEDIEIPVGSLVLMNRTLGRTPISAETPKFDVAYFLGNSCCEENDIVRTYDIRQRYNENISKARIGPIHSVQEICV